MLLKRAPGGFDSCLLVTNKIILFIHIKRKWKDIYQSGVQP